VPYVGGTDSVDGQDDAAADEVRGRYLPAPGGVCGSGGGSSSNSTEWAGTRAYALCDHHVGVKFDDESTAEVLDRLFAGARVNDRRTPDNYSVALGSRAPAGANGPSRGLHLLVRGGTQLVRSRSSARVLAALLQHLSADLLPRPDGLTAVHALAAVGDGDAVLMPRGLLDLVQQLQPRLAKHGLALVDTPHALLDVAACELVVPEPAVPHDASMLAELDDDARFGSELPRVRPGRYPLRTWALSRDPDTLGLLSRGVAVTMAFPTLLDHDDLRDDVERLADLFAVVAPIGVWSPDVGGIVDQLAAATAR
jgi:hypothetical protein